MNVRYRVELSQTERAELAALLSGGKDAARKLKRAQILLAADAGASDDDIARSVCAGGSTVYRTKQRFVLGNLEARGDWWHTGKRGIHARGPWAMACRGIIIQRSSVGYVLTVWPHDQARAR